MTARDDTLDETLELLRDWLARCETPNQAATVARAIVTVLTARYPREIDEKIAETTRVLRGWQGRDDGPLGPCRT